MLHSNNRKNSGDEEEAKNALMARRHRQVKELEIAISMREPRSLHHARLFAPNLI